MPPPNKALQLTRPELRSTARRSVGFAHNGSRRLAPHATIPTQPQQAGRAAERQVRWAAAKKVILRPSLRKADEPSCAYFPLDSPSTTAPHTSRASEARARRPSACFASWSVAVHRLRNIRLDHDYAARGQVGHRDSAPPCPSRTVRPAIRLLLLANRTMANPIAGTVGVNQGRAAAQQGAAADTS